MAQSWDDEDQVDWYLARMQHLAPRQVGERMLLQVAPPRPTSLLDLGCGDGRLAAVVMADRPSLARIVVTDASPAMLDLARQRFASDSRVQIEPHDLTTSIEPLGSFDLVVSGFAIHHLEDERKQHLFSEIANQLAPGGVFLNLEVIRSATPERHQEFLDAIGRSANDPEDRLATVDDQVAWMADAGLRNVDCLWRWRGFALLAGEAPSGEPSQLER